MDTNTSTQPFEVKAEPTQPKSKRNLFIVAGVIVLGLIAWGVYTFVSSVYAYEAQELQWRTQATNFINALVQFDQGLISAASSTAATPKK